MYSKKLTVSNETGLHARPASDFVRMASSFRAEITIQNLTDALDAADAKSIIMVLSQGISQHCDIEIAADGEDEQKAVDDLADLVASFAEKDGGH